MFRFEVLPLFRKLQMQSTILIDTRERRVLIEKKFNYELPYPILMIDGNLELHQMTIEHKEELFLLIDNNRNYLRKWLPWVDDIKSVLDEENFIKSTLNDYSQGRGIHYEIVHDGQIIGNIGLNWIDYNNRSCGVGYWLAEKYTGNGIITKCCKRLMEHCFYDLNFHRFVLEVAVNNIPSIKVANRLGMRLEGKSIDREWLYDHFTDSFLYAITIVEIN
ncbi:MAG: GNAT family N-acetyltransferase [Candidatus Poseidoniales archaeon]|tara:strand:- start:3404 stop:4060 length:657 start_codon:yes stop_codon:yes gene_type:complete